MFPKTVLWSISILYSITIAKLTDQIKQEEKNIKEVSKFEKKENINLKESLSILNPVLQKSGVVTPTLKLIDYLTATTSTLCNLTNCNPINGFCLDSNTCQCLTGFVNVVTE